MTAAASIVGKHTLFKEHAMEFSATLALFAAIITSPLLFLIDYSTIPVHAWLLIIFVAFLGATAYLLVSKAIRHAPISLTSPLFALNPSIVALLAFMILGERISPTGIGGILCVMVGAYILEHHKGVSLVKNLRIILHERHVRLMLGALVLYAFCGVTDRYLLSPSSIGGLGIEPMVYLPIVQLFIAIIYLGMLTFFHDGYKGIQHGIKHAWLPILVIAMLTVGYRATGLLSLAQEGGKVALFVGLKRTSIVWSSLVGGTLFHEDHILQRGVAAGVMVCGIVLIII